MERIEVNKDLSLSRIIQGFWRLSHWNNKPEDTLRFMEECLELGITSFDNADIYMAEELQGNAMKLNPTLRDKIEIITKCGIKPMNALFPENKMLQYNSSKEHIVTCAENSLRRLGTDHIDLLLIHRPDFIMDPEEIGEAFNELKKSGKVFNFGVSNFTSSQFSMLQSYVDVPLVTNQVEVSPLHLDPIADGSFDFMLEKRINPMAWSPLAGGRIFTGEDERAVRLRGSLDRIKEEIGANSIDEVIYAWLLRHPVKIMPIVGSGKIERTKAAVNALQLNFTRDHWYEIWQSSLGRNID
ncbi:aldo/keto reductase [Clostridium sp. LP20]|uniref:aldo/keto reductase n=1 Tax=Clostridium sp. LP20 TaxID=3418665 RepID=UPI003EE62D5C